MGTELFSDINWLAVLVATLSYFIIGAIWYSKVLFGKKWAALVGIDMNDPNKKSGLGQMMLTTFILTLIICIALALLINRMDLTVPISGLRLGLLTGLCFATTSVSISFIYESRPAALYFIDCGYHVVGQIAAALILVLWR